MGFAPTPPAPLHMTTLTTADQNPDTTRCVIELTYSFIQSSAQRQPTHIVTARRAVVTQVGDCSQRGRIAV